MKYLRSAMRRSKHRKPPSLYIHTTSREKSPCCSSILSDCDADDERGFMSSGDFLPSRPLSLTIPAGPYCPRRPTLQEVLADTAPPPWTLSAFMAYLSQNHCLETLEFTMDSNRYSKHYKEMLGPETDTPITPSAPEVEYVRMLWQKLLDAYITPNGPREVNLPANVRDHLLELPSHLAPPNPSVLEPAVKIIYELMDESVLVPFLNSVAPSRGANTYTDPWASDDMPVHDMSASLDERAFSPSKSKSKRNSSPSVRNEMISPVPHGSHRRLHQPSHMSSPHNLNPIARLSTYISGNSTSSSTEGPESLTDGSTDSPTLSAAELEPMTPPSTPPTANLAFSPGTSPSSKSESSGWKKMGARLGWKKSRSGSGHASSTSSSRYPLKENKSQDSHTL